MAMMGRDDYAKAYSTIKSRKQKTQGVIYLEDITDKDFWGGIAFNHVVKLYSENGRTFTGKSKLLQICSANQLIAIDSDFDDLCPQHRPESILCSEKKAYILQTYAHGRENIVFSPECLHEILDSKFKLYLDNHDNPILEIFEKLSAIWFEPYRKFLFLFNQNQYQHDDWVKAISLEKQEFQDVVSKMDFLHYQNRMTELDTQFNQMIGNRVEFDDFCEQLNQKDFTKQNVWAFIRCHDFEDKFVLPFIKEIVKIRQNKELGNIETDYSEMETSNRKREIANYFKEYNNVKTVLHHYFHDVYFPQVKDNHFFLRKIVADYANIIQQ